MTAISKWQREYSGLTDYIATNSQISIDQTSIGIPADVRDGFYRRFDSVRRTFVEEHCQSLTEAASVLSDNYTQIERQVVEQLGIDSITLPVDLASFLHNPQDGLMRALFFPLFDFIQGKIPQEDFAQQLAGELVARAAGLVRYGYQIWSTLALIHLLEPDKAYIPYLKETQGEADEIMLQEPRLIALGSQPSEPPIRLPELVLCSRRLGQHVAFKLELDTDIPRYQGIFGGMPEKNRAMKYSGDTSGVLGDRALLFYVINNAREVPVIADIGKRTIAQPDLIVEWTRPGDVDDPFVLDQVKQRYDILKPKQGTCLVSSEPLGQVSLEIEGYDLHTLSAGFDESKLQPIVDCLATQAS